MDKLTGTGTARGPRSAVVRRRALFQIKPLTSAELIRAGVSPQLLATLALRRARGGGVARLGDHYYDYGRIIPSYLGGIFDDLITAGVLTLAEEVAAGLRRISLTPATLRMTDSQSATTLPAKHPSHAPVPAPADTGTSSCGSVLVPIPGVRYVCAQPPGHASGPHPTACTDAEGILRW